MSKTAKQIIREEYNRLKKVFEKLVRPEKDQNPPQLVLQPERKKRF